MADRRVVITGIGLVTPLGWGREISWKRILAGQSGAGRISSFDPSDYACQVACEVPRVDGRGGGGPEVEGSFDPEKVLAPKELRRVDDFILYAIAAADEAVKDSGWQPEDEASKQRTGVTTEWLGPLKPWRIETWPDARLIRADGMKNGLTRRGPFSCSSIAVRSMEPSPPMPEPMSTPVRCLEASSSGCQPESFTASSAAAMA